MHLWELTSPTLTCRLCLISLEAHLGTRPCLPLLAPTLLALVPACDL